MIGAKDLRIGNIVLSYGEIIKVESIHPKGINIECGYDDIEVGAEYEDLKPIVLSQQCLVLFGLGVGLIPLEEIGKGRFLQLVQKGDNYIIRIKNHSRQCYLCKVFYFHQLQNIYFDLVGTPLKYISPDVWIKKNKVL